MKKRFLLLLLNLIFIFTSCYHEIEEINRKCDLEDISLDFTNARTTYNKGDQFDKTGIKLLCYYSDGTIEEETNLDLLRVFEFSSEEIGKKQVHFFYKGFEKTVDIIIENKVPVMFKMLNPPKDLIYKNTDENAKIDGLKMAVIYNDNTEEPIENLENVCKIKYNKGHKRIEISHNSYDISVFEINIIQANLDIYKLEIKAPEHFPNYKPGEYIDVGLLDVEVYYKDSTGNVHKLTKINNDIPFYYNIYQVPEGYSELVLPIICYASPNVVGHFKVNVVNAYSISSSLTINSEYFNCNYEGEALSFTNEKLFKFTELLDNGKSNSIDNENLRYSTVNLENSDETFPNKSIKLSEPIILMPSNDKQTIWFYHKYMDHKANKERIRKWSQDLIVKQAKIKELKANFKFNTGVNSIPLEREPDPDFENKYGSWNITAIWTNGKESTVVPSDCNFSFVKNKAPAENNKSGTIQIQLKRLKNEEELKTTYIMNYGDKILTSIDFPNNGVVSLIKTESNYMLKNDYLTLNYSDGTKDRTKQEFYIVENTSIKTEEWSSLSIKENKDASDSFKTKIYILSLEQKSENTQSDGNDPNEG